MIILIKHEEVSGSTIETNQLLIMLALLLIFLLTVLPKYKGKITGKIPDDRNTKDVEIAVMVQLFQKNA